MTDHEMFQLVMGLLGDPINFVFELSGSIFTWANVHRVWKDKGYAGLYLPAVVVFASWGVWNLFYYPSLGQWMSFYAGCSLVLANISWFAIAVYYGPIERSPRP
jgi:hypothetical protein